MAITQILIADSSSLTVFGIEALLKERSDTIIEKAENGDALLSLAKADQPNIILLGDRFDPLFDTLALVEKLLQITPSSRIIVMSALSDGLFIRDLFAIGVSGYLMAGDDLTTCLSTALEMALRQRLYLSPTANAEYLIAMQSRNRDWKLDSESRTVLRLLARGCTAGEIAAQLQLKRRRVYWVTEKMRARFGAATNEHLITRAAAEGFAGFPD